MHRAARLLACLAAGAVWLLAVPAASAADIYVYKAADGSRLITDHPRTEPGYRLIKVYPVADVWQQTGKRRLAAARPVPSSYDTLIQNTAHSVSLDPMLIKSVMHAESAFNPDAVSSKGASGLMQLMPGTARRYGVSSVFDPRQNVMGGARYLSYLLDRFDGDLELALAGYNAGENAVDRNGGIPPYAETQHYVKKVMELYRQYRNEGCAQHLDETARFSGKIISCSASLRGPADSASDSPSISNVKMDVSSNDASLLSAEDSQGQWRHVE